MNPKIGQKIHNVVDRGVKIALPSLQHKILYRDAFLLIQSRWSADIFFRMTQTLPVIYHCPLPNPKNESDFGMGYHQPS
jgi:hypothetical protein